MECLGTTGVTGGGITGNCANGSGGLNWVMVGTVDVAGGAMTVVGMAGSLSEGNLMRSQAMVSSRQLWRNEIQVRLSS